MNELLGWYGYDGMEKLDLTSKTLHTASLNSDDSSKNERNNKRNNNGTDNMNLNNISRENSKSPSSVRKSDKQDNICGWCRREVPENSPEFLTTSNGFRYCSESCFAQSRRASFKKAKTCDWCRHVRHAVSYVDFQDGASQLQFCSDKCLNQYKMQIFCKETQEHLDMNPHLKEKGFNKSGGLITPELWLQNCRSRSISPTSELSRSPTPPEQIVQTSTQKSSYKPIISVTPVSKLMSKNSSHLSVRHLPKHTRRRKSTKITIAPNNNGCMSNDFLNLTDSGEGIKSKNLSDSLKTNINIPTSSNFPDAQYIDFGISSVPPNNAAFHNIPSALSQRINLPQPLFQNPDKSCQARHPFSELSVQNQQLGLASHSSLASTSNIHADLTQSKFLGSPMPPVTVMVPYPIIIPLPIPIPILLPITSFIKAAKQENETSTAKNSLKNDCSTNNSESSSKTIVSEPLDFTKSKASTEIQKIDKNSDKKYILSSTDSDESNISDQKLVSPKLKISRVCAKRIAKESEKSRPLRKRKRIIDYLRNSKNYDDNRHIK